MRETETYGAVSLRESLFAYIDSQYGGTPEYLWARFPDYAVFRHTANRKWFAPVMNVSCCKLGLSGADTADLTDRPFFVGVQYHPEFKSRPNKPHPLFLGFIGAAFEKAKEQG